VFSGYSINYNLRGTFRDCENLKSLDISWLNTSPSEANGYVHFVNLGYFCANNTKLESFTFTVMENVAHSKDGTYYSVNNMFDECSSLKTIIDWEDKNVVDSDLGDIPEGGTYYGPNTYSPRYPTLVEKNWTIINTSDTPVYDYNFLKGENKDILCYGDNPTI
jgi:surface protein